MEGTGSGSNFATNFATIPHHKAAHSITPHPRRPRAAATRSPYQRGSCRGRGGAPGGNRTPDPRLRSPSAFAVFSASCRTGSTIEGTNRFAGQRHRQRLSPPPPGHVQSSPCPPRATITGSRIRHRVDSTIHQEPSKHPVERRQSSPSKIGVTETPESREPVAGSNPGLEQQNTTRQANLRRNRLAPQALRVDQDGELDPGQRRALL